MAARPRQRFQKVRARARQVGVRAVNFGTDIWQALLSVAVTPGVIISVILIAVAIAAHADSAADSALTSILNYVSKLFPAVKTYCDYLISEEHVLNGVLVFLPLLFGSPGGKGAPAYIVAALWVFLSHKQSLMMYYAQCVIVLVIQRMPRRSAGVITLVASIAMCAVYFGHFHGVALASSPSSPTGSVGGTHPGKGPAPIKTT